MITVVGVHGARTVAAFALGHGEDPLDGLHARGWTGRAERVEGVRGDLTLRYAVDPARPGAASTGPGGPQGPGLDATERAGVTPHQRVAAYAVVVEDGRLLLTQLAARTGAGGRWNLPGGGLDPGEGPRDAVVREVLEETGQVVEGVELVDVMTQHWIGRSPRGLEDYHAVRLLHTARCPRPTAPVVHDVGGSTADARWVRLDELGSVEVVASVAVALRAAGVADLHAGPQS
ncbi:NUDIX hydrolase [Oryzobacter terrae]|uniref:NUDIX hydrolase n=1 Tax=Oryzobacter terrae TaxID=1620385 RepID=UPI003670DAA1